MDIKEKEFASFLDTRLVSKVPVLVNDRRINAKYVVNLIDYRNPTREIIMGQLYSQLGEVSHVAGSFFNAIAAVIDGGLDIIENIDESRNKIIALLKKELLELKEDDSVLYMEDIQRIDSQIESLTDGNLHEVYTLLSDLDDEINKRQPTTIELAYMESRLYYYRGSMPMVFKRRLTYELGVLNMPLMQHLYHFPYHFPYSTKASDYSPEIISVVEKIKNWKHDFTQ